jgi:bifunctional DNA-binding transcriptional regulator/antitoxin component of YhaV-PrlF toxin-antitoxin module
MVRLQKLFAYKYKDKDHYKHLITVPDEIVRKLGWSAGSELEYSVNGKELVFRLRKPEMRAVKGKGDAKT